MIDCIFCKIVNGEIPAKRVFENDYVVAFEDIAPTAPTHVLVIPKRHIAAIRDVSENDIETMGQLVYGIKQTADKLGIVEGGYRTVINTGADAGQTVFHIHAHILAGRKLEWLLVNVSS